MDSTYLAQYQQLIVELYKQPLHKGVLLDATEKKEANNPSCGDSLTLYLRWEDDVLADAQFDGDGCAISVAAASLLLEDIQGKKKTEIAKITAQDMKALLGIPVSYTREKCALLCYSALQELL